jgi:hypothetical protein
VRHPKPRQPLTPAEELDELAKVLRVKEAFIKSAQTSLTDMERAIERSRREGTRDGEATLAQRLDVEKRLKDVLAAAQREVGDLKTRIRKLENQPPAAPDLSVIDVTIGGKELGYPLHVNEHDKDGKLVGGVRIEPHAMLLRYLARTRLDPAAPKRLRLVAWTDAPNDHIKETLRTCQKAGFTEAVFHGKMPTNDPEITFTPPANDPGGKRDGWFEADEVPIKFAELLRPPAKPKP